MDTHRKCIALFDTHADEVFASFVSRGQTRDEAISSTEKFFLSLVSDHAQAPSVGQRVYKKFSFGFTKRLSHMSS